MSKTNHKFAYQWYLKNDYPAPNIDYHAKKVFGTFICGGGSTMGYKLAGFNHLGGVEIDKQVAEIYKLNHNPKYLYNEDIRLFRQRENLPSELFELDLLDGSPPCSTFSMAGSREKAWGKEKQFREGQTKQTLDDLFFEYIALAKRLQPKVVLAENVKGLIQGNARFYVSEIINQFKEAGYETQLFCLNAASMGVPQKRERVFFICQRKDLKLPKLRLEFDETPIPFREIADNNDKQIENKTECSKLYQLTKEGNAFSTAHIKGNFFNDNRASKNEVIPTITADKGHGTWHNEIQRKLNNVEIIKAGSYPLDYNFNGIEPKYLIGMSVPPTMCAQIAHQIYLQWLSKI